MTKKKPVNPKKVASCNKEDTLLCTRKVMVIHYDQDKELYDLYEAVNANGEIEVLTLGHSEYDGAWCSKEPVVSLKDTGNEVQFVINGTQVSFDYSELHMLHLALWKYYKSQKIKCKVDIFRLEKES